MLPDFDVWTRNDRLGQPLDDTWRDTDLMQMIKADSTVQKSEDGTNGNDTLFGGDGDDHIRGLKGNDTISAKKGDDFIEGGKGEDSISGGRGNDTVNGDRGFDSLWGDRGDDIMNGGGGKDTAYGGDGNDRIWGDGENDTIYGDTGADRVWGGAGKDKLFGGAGGDTVVAGGGNDKIKGQGGNDTLEGGAGMDLIQGNAGKDTFVYKSASHSAAGVDTRDTIFDFTHTVDRIDLSAIDADTTRGGNQAFAFIGTSGFSDAGQLRAKVAGSNIILQADRNGDGKADMEIKLIGPLTVDSFDFIL